MSGFSKDQAGAALLLGWTQEQIRDIHNQLQIIIDGDTRVDRIFTWGLLDTDGKIWYRAVSGAEQMALYHSLDLRRPSGYFTDGSGTTFDKPAGIGVFAMHADFTDFVAENIGPGTNNRAELAAIWRALRDGSHVEKELVIYSDSEYAIGSCTKNWTPKANANLIRDIREDLSLRKQPVTFHHVPGHRDVEGNEIADKLANIGRKLVTKVTFYTP